MQLLTIDSREVTGRPGVLLPGGEILDLAAAPRSMSDAQWIPHSVVSVLAATDGLERVDRIVASASDKDALRTSGALLPFAGTALLAPVRRPGMLLIADANGAGNIKNPNSAVGHMSQVTIVAPTADTLVSTAMLGVVFGRPVFQAAPDAIEHAIAGFTLLSTLHSKAAPSSNDAAEWKSYDDSGQFPGACPMGPVIVTRDELAGSAFTARIRINDVEVHHGPLLANAGDLMNQIAGLAQRYAFRPGDVVALESADQSRQKLHRGDRYSVELDDDVPALEFTVH